MLNYWGPQLVWIISSMLSLVTIVALWVSADSGADIAGYSKDQLITYAIVGLAAGAFINFNPFPGAKGKIKDGSFASHYMLKPVSFFFERLVWETTWRTYFLAFNVAATIIALIIFSQYVEFSFEITSLPSLVIAIGLATLLQFTFTMCLSLVAFWYTEVNALNTFKYVALGVLGGMAIPISFIPGYFQQLVMLLPFRYMYSFPMEIFFSKISGSQIIYGLILQIFWLSVFLILYKVMYRSGVKKYVSVGQ